MNLKDALLKIEQLEKRIKELEARPPVTHTHFHYQNPSYQNPSIGNPLPPWTITCGGIGGYATPASGCLPQN